MLVRRTLFLATLAMTDPAVEVDSVRCGDVQQ
jgi:hypothetical protein